MAKTLLIVAAVISLITAGLGFVNQGKIAEANAAAQTAESTLTSTQGTLKKTQAELKQLQENLAVAQGDQEKAAAALTAAQADAQKAQSELTAAKDAAAAKDSQIQSLTAELDDAKRRLAEVAEGGNPAAAPTEDPRVKELEALVASQDAKLKAADSQLADLRKRDEARRTKQMQQGLEGRVLAVNPAWNFVVLSIGDRQGVVSNAELLLKRGGQYLGKVRVTAVEPATSIADIVANTLPAGVSVQPGDSVIFQGSEE